jgi:hypothetical protein
VELQSLAPGLWRWTAPHPEWEEPEQKDSPADWPRDVGCVAYAGRDSLVLIDPLVVDGDYAPLDELAESKDGVAILTTLRFHERSGEELAKRYTATSTPPDDVEPVPIDGADETMFWISEHRALVPGDRILGDRPPGLRLCPDSWMRYLGGYTRDDLRQALRRRLLDLPIDMVLVSHGAPVLSDGHAALEQVLE